VTLQRGAARTSGIAGLPAISLTPTDPSSKVPSKSYPNQGALSNTVSNIQYSIVSSGDDSFVTAFVPGEPAPLVAAKSGHPNFDAIIEALVAGDAERDEVVGLFDVSQAVQSRFENLSDRVQVGSGRVLFDGAEVDNSLTKQIVRFLSEKVSDWKPLVNFMERVMDNPNEHSREQLYTWLDRHDFTITPEGNIVAYKGVSNDGEHGYRSISSGNETVYVDGEAHKGRIPNPVGAVVNMDRNLVHHDPSQGCSRGLHVGTYDYASSFSRGTVLECHVNPRDIVSVPTDCGWAKVRTCRYRVVKAIDAPYSTGVLDYDGSDLDEDGWDF
jgi:hypothetical protein